VERNNNNIYWNVSIFYNVYGHITYILGGSMEYNKIDEVKMLCKMLVKAIEEHEFRKENDKQYQRYFEYGRWKEVSKVKNTSKLLSILLVEMRN